jgi:hypothetical protein
MMASTRRCRSGDSGRRSFWKIWVTWSLHGALGDVQPGGDGPVGHPSAISPRTSRSRWTEVGEQVGPPAPSPAGARRSWGRSSSPRPRCGAGRPPRWRCRTATVGWPAAGGRRPRPGDDPPLLLADKPTALVAHSGTGQLYTVDPTRGRARPSAGSAWRLSTGLCWGRAGSGRAELEQPGEHDPAGPDLDSGVVEEVITSDRFQVPTTAARFGSHPAVVDAKFDTGFPPTADQYQVILVDW